jgi:hypothetical protein
MAFVQGTPIAGYEGRFQIGGVNLQLNSWKINFTADDLPTRTFESDGWDSGITGFAGAEIDIEGYWDGDQPPHTDPLTFVAGEIITTPIYLYVRKTGSRRYRFNSVRILSVPVQNECENKVMYQVKMKSNGSWTYAT